MSGAPCILPYLVCTSLCLLMALASASIVVSYNFPGPALEAMRVAVVPAGMSLTSKPESRYASVDVE